MILSAALQSPAAWAESPVPTIVTGQVGDFSVTLEQPSGMDYNLRPLNADACKAANQALSIRWDASKYVSTSASAQIKIFVRSDASCANDTQPTALFSQPFAQYRTGYFPLNLDAAVLSTRGILDAGKACDAGALVSQALYAVCVVIDDPGNGTQSDKRRYTSYLPVNVDTKPPLAVTAFKVTGGDRSLSLSWQTSDSDIVEFRYQATSPGLLTLEGVFSAADRTGVIEKAQNGALYNVTLTAVDAAGNVGPTGTPVTAQPLDQCDAWECYGGREQGGFCFIATAAYGHYDAPFVQQFRLFRDRVMMKSQWGQALILTYYRHGVSAAVWLTQHPALRWLTAKALVLVYVAAWPVLNLQGWSFALFVALCALPVALALRKSQAIPRRRRWLLLPLVWMMSAHAAHADETSQEARPRWSVGLKMGPYRPNIDADPGANGFYEKFFGPSGAAVTGKGRKIRADIDFEVYFWRRVGLLGVNFTGGFWTASAKTKICAGERCTPADLDKAVGTDKTQLFLIPLALSLTYKFDYLFERYRVPIIPYVRAGLDSYVWRINSGSTLASKEVLGTTRNGHGATFGFHVHPGIALKLDFLESRPIREARGDFNFHGFYLNFEWIYNRIDDFGSAKSWNLSDNSFLLGLSLDF